ncbi:hypothetical protein E6C67_01975 [Azospirillum sp. TSA2s]|uniref:hypothetical protein n=1 Tax=Azospirillum sp. TSA2s TaxID=709810 RepID=UPI0010AAF989|nr:hypothetical protein [Azospirillum sp. TSA2s]QCG92705.1 hypothetical protein E6C67_01975 [Azospirillum sp. TSA2s]
MPFHWLRMGAQIIGVLGSLLAAEGLLRIATFVSSVGGHDAKFYYFGLFVVVCTVLALFAALLGRFNRLAKYATLVGLLGAGGLLLASPGLPVIFQALLGIILAIIGIVSIRLPPKLQTTVA